MSVGSTGDIYTLLVLVLFSCVLLPCLFTLVPRVVLYWCSSSIATLQFTLGLLGWVRTWDQGRTFVCENFDRLPFTPLLVAFLGPTIGIKAGLVSL